MHTVHQSQQWIFEYCKSLNRSSIWINASETWEWLVCLVLRDQIDSFSQRYSIKSSQIHDYPCSVAVLVSAHHTHHLHLLQSQNKCIMVVNHMCISVNELMSVLIKYLSLIDAWLKTSGNKQTRSSIHYSFFLVCLCSVDKCCGINPIQSWPIKMAGNKKK